jgi:hypothetical protein
MLEYEKKFFEINKEFFDYFRVLTNINYMNNRTHFKNIRTGRNTTTDRRVGLI